MGRRPKQLLFLRTNRFDRQAQDLLSDIRHDTPIDIVVCADERGGQVETPGFDKVSLTDASIVDLGLYNHQRAGWQCGDYFAYHVRKEYPDFEHYWMIEPDVYFAFDDVRRIFHRTSRSDADMIGVHFGRRPASWGWHHAMSQLYPAVFGVGVQFIRLSAAAVDHLHAERARLSLQMNETTAFQWANDESFVATVLANDEKWQCLDLSEIFRRTVYSRESLRTSLPFLLEDLKAAETDKLIYHPVLPRERFLEKVDGHVARNRDLDARTIAVIRRHYTPAEIAAFPTIRRLLDV